MTTETQPHLVEVHQAGEVMVVRFVRRTILDPLTIEMLGGQLVDLIRAHGCKRLVLDFDKVESLTSAMLGTFAALQVRVAENGGRMVCCNVGDFLRQIFTVCKFPETIPIHADEASAIAALG